MVRFLCAVCCVLAWPTTVALAETSQLELRLLERVEQDLGKQNSRRALHRLTRALAARVLTEPKLWLHYAELSVPCTAEELLEPSPAELRQAARAWEHFPEQLARDSLLDDESPQLFRRTLLHRAVFLGLVDQWPKAFETLRLAARRADLESVSCVRQLAGQAVAQGHLKEARAALAFARSLAPEDHLLPRELGLVMLALGDAEASIGQLEAALAAEPQDLEVRRDLAYALASAGRASEGYALLASDIRRCTETSRCLLELARLALEASSFEQAEQHANALVMREPKQVESWSMLGEVQSRRENVTAAKRAYEEVLRLSPGHRRAQEALKSLGQ